jgi:hypothetical protein
VIWTPAKKWQIRRKFSFTKNDFCDVCYKNRVFCEWSGGKKLETCRAQKVTFWTGCKWTARQIYLNEWDLNSWLARGPCTHSQPSIQKHFFLFFSFKFEWLLSSTEPRGQCFDHYFWRGFYHINGEKVGDFAWYFLRMHYYLIDVFWAKIFAQILPREHQHKS